MRKILFLSFVILIFNHADGSSETTTATTTTVTPTPASAPKPLALRVDQETEFMETAKTLYHGTLTESQRRSSKESGDSPKLSPNSSDTPEQALNKVRSRFREYARSFFSKVYVTKQGSTPALNALTAESEELKTLAASLTAKKNFSTHPLTAQKGKEMCIGAQSTARAPCLESSQKWFNAAEEITTEETTSEANLALLTKISYYMGCYIIANDINQMCTKEEAAAAAARRIQAFVRERQARKAANDAR